MRAPKGMRIAKCGYCGETKPVFKEHGYCENCESDHLIWCSVCGEWLDQDDKCRHIFETECDWSGSGTIGAKGRLLEWEHIQLEPIRESFFAVLSEMPFGFAQALRSAIASGEFYTWFTAPLIGSGGILELNGMPNRYGRYSETWWGEQLIELAGGSKDFDATHDTYGWLASLYKRDTPRANRITLRWLDEYIGMERAARLWSAAA